MLNQIIEIIESIGIHTLMFSYRLDRDLFYKLKKLLYKYAEENRLGMKPEYFDLSTDLLSAKYKNKSNTYWESHTLYTRKGLQIVLIEYNVKTTASSSGKLKSCWVRYIVNPHRLLGGDRYNIHTTNNFIDIFDRVNEIVAPINRDLPYLHEMSLIRLDFCKNICLTDPDEVKWYIEFLNKNRRRDKGFVIKPYKDRHGEELPHNISLAFERGDTVLYLYDKYEEMKSKADYYSAEDIVKSYGVLRIELRITNDKIFYEKNKADIADNMEFLNYAILKAEANIKHYIKMLFFSGDYYSFAQAKTIINNTPTIYTDTRENLINFLYYISKHDGIHRGMERMKKEIFAKMKEDGDNKFHKIPRKIETMLDKLNEIGVNPVTFSKRKNIDYFQNLYNRF
jgi:hypothetical protein